MKKFDILADASFNLIEASEKNEANINRLIGYLKSTIEALEDNVSNIERQVRNSVQDSNRQSANYISNQVLYQLSDANIAAERAARRYESAAKLSIFKLGFIFFLFFLMAGALLWVFFIKEIPTIEEITELRSEKRKLEQQVRQLRSYGKVSYCGKNNLPCIQVDMSKGYGEKGEASYFVILSRRYTNHIEEALN